MASNAPVINNFGTPPPTNALTYTYIPNTLTGNEVIKLSLANPSTDNTTQGEINHLNNILKYGTIKKACCLYNTPSTQATSFTVPVRIPLPKEKQFSDYGSNEPLFRKYNFVEVQITIPKSLCSHPMLNFTTTPGITFTNGTSVCNDFMKTYCRNISKHFRKATNLSVDALKYTVDFPEFKPECACYTEFSPKLEELKVTPVCSVQGCEKTSLSVYHAPFEPCNSTICQNSITFYDVLAGGNISVLPKMSNSCSGSGGNVVNTTTPVVPIVPIVRTPAPGETLPAVTTPVPTTRAPVTTALATGGNQIQTTQPNQGYISQLFSSPSATNTGNQTTQGSSSSTVIIIVVVIIIIIIIIAVVGFLFMRNRNKNKQN